MSKFLKALEEAERERALREDAGRRFRDTGGGATSEEAGDDANHRVVRWIAEGQELLRALPLLLAEHTQFRVRAEQAERECEQLRRDIGEIEEHLRLVIHATLRPLQDRLQKLRLVRATEHGPPSPAAPVDSSGSRPAPSWETRTPARSLSSDITGPA